MNKCLSKSLCTLATLKKIYICKLFYLVTIPVVASLAVNEKVAYYINIPLKSFYLSKVSESSKVSQANIGTD